MKARQKTLVALRRQSGAAGAAHLREQLAEIDPTFDGSVRIASEFPKIPKVGGIDNEVGGHLKRAIPADYPYDPKAIKPLAKMLWAMSVALGHAMTAHRQFTKMKSATVSPDGLIGGRGYVMAVKDVRKALYDACEALSAISDTIHDEIHAPHWKPRLAQLEKDDKESVERLVGDAERMLDDPGNEVDEEMDEAEKSGPKWDAEKELGEEEPQSGMPDGDDLADSRPQKRDKQASTVRRANSSLPVETMSGGPRVDHMDRADQDQTGPFGSYNRDEPVSLDDQWSKDQGVGGEYNYPSDWDNDLREKEAAAAIPDATTDQTPTEGYDFGIGYGEGNDAHGQGAGGYGNISPDGRGVYGPSSGLPKDPGAKLHDNEESDSTPTIELAVGDRSTPREASAWKVNEAVLPNDDQPDVARSDYYQGSKGSNMRDSAPSNVGAAKLPGTQLPAKAAPLTPRPAHVEEHMFGSGELPGEPESNYEFDKDIGPSTGYRYERGDQPYIKWDSNTHNMRPDPVYQREVEGPYVKQQEG